MESKLFFLILLKNICGLGLTFPKRSELLANEKNKLKSSMMPTNVKTEEQNSGRSDYENSRASGTEKRNNISNSLLESVNLAREGDVSRLKTNNPSISEAKDPKPTAEDKGIANNLVSNVKSMLEPSVPSEHGDKNLFSKLDETNNDEAPATTNESDKKKYPITTNDLKAEEVINKSIAAKSEINKIAEWKKFPVVATVDTKMDQFGLPEDRTEQKQEIGNPDEPHKKQYPEIVQANLSEKHSNAEKDLPSKREDEPETKKFEKDSTKLEEETKQLEKERAKAEKKASKLTEQEIDRNLFSFVANLKPQENPLINN